MQVPNRKQKEYKPRRVHPLDTYRDLFRFKEENVTWMADYFLGESTETRGGALNSKQRMEVFLRCIGDPGFQIGVGEDIGITQSTVSKTFTAVLDKVVEKADTWIMFPNEPHDFQAAKDAWQAKYQFPCAIGALDCTHIQIEKPGHHGDEYVCRKGTATLNVQATCDAAERFTSVEANWPGSVHDSRIWKNSAVGALMSQSVTDALLLGDEGYGVAPWLMTPFKEPLDSEEKASYNRCHKNERQIIERCFGQLKRRFPILQGRVRIQLRNVPSLIVACCILHNVAKYIKDPDDFPEYEDFQVDNNDVYEDHPRIRQRGQDRRRQIADIIHANYE